MLSPANDNPKPYNPHLLDALRHENLTASEITADELAEAIALEALTGAANGTCIMALIFCHDVLKLISNDAAFQTLKVNLLMHEAIKRAAHALQKQGLRHA